MATCVLPTPVDVGKVLGDLVGKPVKAGAGAAYDPGSEPGVIGAYTVNGEDLVAVFACHVAVAAGTGAALSMIPPGAAEDCVKSGKLTENILENFGEVLNITSQFFEGPGHPRNKLRAIHTTEEPLPEDVAGLIAGPTERLDLEVEIPGYGKGSVSLLIK